MGRKRLSTKGAPLLYLKCSNPKRYEPAKHQFGGLAIKGSGGDLLSRKCSTIGARGLNFRVRDEIGCGPSAIATGKMIGPPLGGAFSVNIQC